MNFEAQYEQLMSQLPKDYLDRWTAVIKSTVNSSVPGTATAFQPWNLDLMGKLLLPEKTPFQNEGCYAVKNGEPGNNREYRAIVAQNVAKHTGAAIEATSSLSTGAGLTGRANTIDYTFLVRKKLFTKIAPESVVTRELYDQSGPFDALGKATVASLIVAKELEERHILFDVASTALGTPAQPTGVPSNTGGSLTNAASPYTIKVIALNYYGWWYWVPDGTPAADITPITTFGLGAGAVQGESIASAASANITIAAGTTGSIAAAVTPIKGAYGYIWWLITGGTGHVSAITTTPFATLTVPGTLTIATPTADGSLFDLDGFPVVWDGLFSQTVLDADIPGEYLSLQPNSVPGVFTSVGAGSGVQEIETILANLWTKWKASPKYAVMSPKTLRTLSNVAIGSAAPAYRLNIDAEGSKGNIIAGTILAGIRNQYAESVITPIREMVMPDGKIMFYTKEIDYKDANIATNLELHCGVHWLQDFFARITDVSPMGPWSIRTYGAPVLHWPRGCGVLDDILVT